MFVQTPGKYGAQWVGKSGGTGDQRKAVRITVKAGKGAMDLPGDQPEELEYILDIGHGRYLGGWYGGKDLTVAKKMAIPKTGPKTVTFMVG